VAWPGQSGGLKTAALDRQLSRRGHTVGQICSSEEKPRVSINSAEGGARRIRYAFADRKLHRTARSVPERSSNSPALRCAGPLRMTRLPAGGPLGNRQREAAAESLVIIGCSWRRVICRGNCSQPWCAGSKGFWHPSDSRSSLAPENRSIERFRASRA